jgi:carbamate kinase
MPRTAVVALGGNAITRPGQRGTYLEQTANAHAMAGAVCGLRDAGWRVVVVHGNGPQVGNLMIQHERAAAEVAALPLFCLDAMTEGQLGSLLALALREATGDRPLDVVAVVTHVVVDSRDPAFARPTKPIGPFLEAAEAERLAAEHDWRVAADAGRGHRRLVASPAPARIVELDAIRALVERGTVVIAAGGGGVPVVAAASGYVGIEAVIDKDLAAQTLATALGAEALVLVTDIGQVQLDFGTERQRPISQVTANEAQRHLDDEQFPDGSMGPKIRAAINFLRAGGRVAVITNADGVVPSLDPESPGEAGTRIIASEHPIGAGR